MELQKTGMKVVGVELGRKDFVEWCFLSNENVEQIYEEGSKQALLLFLTSSNSSVTSNILQEIEIILARNRSEKVSS